MEDGLLYRISADVVLLVHALFVGFVLFGQALVLIGRFRHWFWVRNPWFRVAHLCAIGIVVLQSWLGVVCPLTTWEMALRARAGDAVYTGAFVAHWVESVLYYQAPPGVFAVCYTLFGALVAACWYWIRPRPFLRAGR